MEDAKNFTLSIVKSLMEEDFKFYESMFPESVKKARKCLKYIHCINCIDTKRIVRREDGYLFGYYYNEYSCPFCTGYCHKIGNHSDPAHAVSDKGRRIPASKESGYSYTIQLARIYEIEYEALDKLKEEMSNNSK